MTDGLDRLKVLINSSTPIVVMETSEEMHAVSMVRAACSQLNMATFEWSIADGLLRSGSNTPLDAPKTSLQARIDQDTMLASDRAQLRAIANRSQPRWRGSGAAGSSHEFRPRSRWRRGGHGTAIYNTREPVQALANMESMTVEAVFILKDFHRHMDDPIVIRRLRDVGQKFATNRRTVIITAPEIAMPAELTKLVEYFDLPAPRSRPPARNHSTRYSRPPLQDLHVEAAAR